MTDLFDAKEKLEELLECLIKEYQAEKNSELLKSIKICNDLCFRFGRIIEGFGKEADLNV